MNSIDKIVAEAKTQKAAAEKVHALAARVGVEAPSPEADFFLAFVKLYKQGKAQDVAEAILQAERAWKREQERLWLERAAPLGEVSKAISEIDGKLGEWCTKFRQDPLYELSWGNKVFQMAAQMKVYGELLRFLEGCPEPTPEQWGEFVEAQRRAALDMARGTSRSTSPCSNLADDFLRAARAEACGTSEWVFGKVAYWVDCKARWDAGEAEAD